MQLQSRKMATSIVRCAVIILSLLALSSISATMADSIGNMVKVNAGNPTFSNNGDIIDLILIQKQASGFESIRKDLLFTRIDMQVKLPGGNSAGIVTTLYMSSAWESLHDEIDIEFLGNVTGEPYTLHTNVYTLGQGNKEMQYRLWFDPSADFHTYTILWNTQFIIFYVDGIPLRAFPNLSGKNIAFPSTKPMGVYASIWNADDWCTQGGRIKTNWTTSPTFTASYTNFVITECSSSSTDPKCYLPGPITVNDGVPQLDSWTRNNINTMQKYNIYNYCVDSKRFPNGFGPECVYQNQI